MDAEVKITGVLERQGVRCYTLRVAPARGHPKTVRRMEKCQTLL